MPGLEDLPPLVVREAATLVAGGEPPESRTSAVRMLREALAVPAAVARVLGSAPVGARDAFVRLAGDGPALVEDLLGRGWAGRGMLPPPLDWLQRRALVATGEDGLVHAVDEARRNLGTGTLATDGTADEAAAVQVPLPTLDAIGPTGAGDPPGDAADPFVRVLDVRAVVVADEPGALDRAVAVPGAGLRVVAPTVAVSERSPAVVRAALAEADIVLEGAAVVEARPAEPALPGTAEDAVGPRAIRALLGRALDDARQVRLQYYASSRGGQATDRVVDPWAFTDDLLRGWCHLRGGERTFALDRIGRARLLPTSLEHLAP